MINGRYALKEKLGSGSFGTVRKAWDSKAKENVAIKIFTSENESAALAEINTYRYLERRERRNSQNFVKYLNSFSLNGQWHLVIEFMDSDLSKYIASNGRIRKNEMCHIMRCILQGLKFLHGCGIVHGDLKPLNIGLKTHGRFECKIFDLGAARHLVRVNNNCGIIGTAAYTAPELLLEGPLSGKVDIWSVGCIAGELRRRYVLFGGRSNYQRMRKYVEYFGFPSKYLLAMCSNTSAFFRIVNYAVTMAYTEEEDPCVPNSRRIEDLVREYNDEGFINFLKRCFAMNPAGRSSARELLEDRWLQDNSVPFMQPSETFRWRALLSIILFFVIFLLFCRIDIRRFITPTF